MFFGLFIFVIIVFILNFSFFELLNILNLFCQVVINGLIVFGMIFVILIGGIDFFVGVIFVLFSVLVVGMIVFGVDLVFVIIFGCIIGVVFGMINGLLIIKGKMVFFIVMFVIMIVFCGLMFVYIDGNLIIGFGINYVF